ncbi:MAG: PAS domain S-box protein [Chlorobi bacterium]|nr:PAS domain S-box protein [Chlorobiota bacterium]
MINTKNISARKTAILYIILTAFATALIISMLPVIFNEKQTRQNINTINKLTEKEYKKTIKTELEKIIKLSQITAQTIYLPDSNYLNNTKKTLSEIIKNNPEISGIYIQINNQNKKISTGVIENNGKITTCGSPENDFRIKNTKNTENIISTPVQISEPFKITPENKPEYALTVTVPITKNRKTTGLAALNFKLNKLSEKLNTENCTIILSSPQKNIIASSKPEITGKNILDIHLETIPEHTAYIELENTEYKPELIISCSGKQIYAEYKSKLIYLILLLLATVTAGTLILLTSIKQYFNPLKKISETTEELGKGKPVKNPPENPKPEFKTVIENLNLISQRYDEITKFAKNIISENYSQAKLKEKSNQDQISKALNKITEYLKKENEKRKKHEEEVAEQLWMRKGRFEISEAERFSSKDISELTYNIIRSLVNYIDALMGGIYLYDKQNKTAVLKAAYAYGKQKHTSVTFKEGEGLIGACISEKKKIILKNIPDDYIKITTGLGSGTPEVITVIPVFFKNEITAVIELAFAHTPENRVTEFIEQLSDSIGAWINASLISTKTAELLAVSQKQTQELAEKEEELNKKVAELQEIQEKTADLNTKYKSVLNAVNETIMTVEYTLDGTIISCNKFYTEVMGFENDEIKGKNVAELVKDQADDLYKIIDEVKSGKTVKRQVKRYTKNGEVKQLTATYTPYYDKDGNISRILFFAFDITAT